MVYNASENFCGFSFLLTIAIANCYSQIVEFDESGLAAFENSGSEELIST